MSICTVDASELILVFAVSTIATAWFRAEPKAGVCRLLADSWS